MSLDLCGLGDDRRRAFLRVKKSTSTLERPVRSPPAPKAHETNTGNPVDFPQPEDMKAWLVWKDWDATGVRRGPEVQEVVIGTRANAEDKTGKNKNLVEGPFEFTIAIKP